MWDLLFPIFLFPREIQGLYTDFWLNSGPLGQALCKLAALLLRCLHCCVYSEPGSDSSGSIWNCGISPPLPAHQFKAVPVLHSRHLDRRDGLPLPISLWLKTCWISRKTGLWLALVRSLFHWELYLVTFCGTHFYPVCCDSDSLHHHFFLSSSHKGVQASIQPTLDNNVSKGNEKC